MVQGLKGFFITVTVSKLVFAEVSRSISKAYIPASDPARCVKLGPNNACYQCLLTWEITNELKRVME